MSCLPGMPCYQNDVIVYTKYPRGCGCDPITLPLSSDDILYTGPNLPYTGIQTNTDLSTALQRIDNLLSPEELIGYIVSILDTNPTLKADLQAALA